MKAGDWYQSFFALKGMSGYCSNGDDSISTDLSPAVIQSVGVFCLVMIIANETNNIWKEYIWISTICHDCTKVRNKRDCHHWE